MKTQYAPLFYTILLSILFIGCASQSPDKRIAREQQLFDSYPPEIRESIRNGQVQIGFTDEMVRMALGEPDRYLQRTTEDGHETIFIYTKSKPGFSLGLGGATGGGGSSIGTGVGVSTGGRTQEKLRVILRHDVVVAIEDFS